MGCCALVLASWISPRFVLFLMWIFGDRLDFAFDSFWAGLAGFVFLPWTSVLLRPGLRPDRRGERPRLGLRRPSA